ncbi:MAG: hypothetical protein IID42_04110, partial [Planctomycetes bacterium]|nr:hypothetical protein [Planctomycetota bacterium]
MKTPSVLWIAIVVSAVSFAAAPRALSAAQPFNLINWLTGKDDASQNDDASQPVCDECGGAPDGCRHCVKRIPVTKCVVGKKKVYDCKVRYEYVAIPETKYRWVKRLVTKEIPCDYSKPVCKTEKFDHNYVVEHWEKEDLGCRGELHCKTC